MSYEWGYLCSYRPCTMFLVAPPSTLYRNINLRELKPRSRPSASACELRFESLLRSCPMRLDSVLDNRV